MRNWFLIYCTATGYFVNALGPLGVMYSQESGAPESAYWLLGPAYGLAMIGAGLILVPLLGRGALWMFRLMPAVAALGVAGLTVFNGVGVTAVSALITGLGVATVYCASPGVLSGPDAARDFSLISGVGSVASILAPWAFAAAQYAGVPQRLAIAVVLVPIVLVGARAWTVKDVPGGWKPPAPEITPESAAAGGKLDAAGLALRMFRIALAIGVEFVFYVWGVRWLQEVGASPALAVGLLSLFPIGMAIGRIAFASLTTRPGIIRVFAAVSLAGAAAIIFAPGPGVVAAGYFLAGLGTAGMSPVVTTDLTEKLHGVTSVQGAAIYSVVAGSGIVAVPMILNSLDAFVSLQWGMGATLLLCYGLLLVLPARFARA